MLIKFDENGDDNPTFEASVLPSVTRLIETYTVVSDYGVSSEPTVIGLYYF
jgi:hypothetical protein